MEFSRKLTKEVSEKIQTALNEYFKTSDFTFTMMGGTFTSDKAELKIQVRMKTSDGSVVVSSTLHSIADRAATKAGLKVNGNLIGSVWSKDGYLYTVSDYVVNRPKYPVLLSRSDGRTSKAHISFLTSATQVTVPTEKDFTVWFTLDPDSDAVKESDVEVYDRVHAYMEATYDEEQLDKYLDVAEQFYDKGIAAKYARRAYVALFHQCKTIDMARIGLEAILADN